MPYAAALSTHADTTHALAEVADAATTHLAGSRSDLAVVFFSPHHAPYGRQIAETLTERFGTVVGCLGESIVGPAREVEQEPALSLWLGAFGGAVEVEPFHLMLDDGREGPTLFGWPDSIIECNPEKSALLMLADPHSFPLSELFFPRVHEDYPGLPVVGGMSSGAMAPGQTVLIHNNDVEYAGAVGVLLRGEPCWRTVVSQGCRPIGKPLVVTKGHDNVIEQLGGRVPLDYLKELYDELPVADQQLFQRGLHVGLVMSEYRESFTRGDFLIRNLYGIDRESGSLVVTDRVRVGQTIQFQLRDAATADDDLRSLLRADKAAHGPANGALLFTCNGRGARIPPLAAAIPPETGASTIS